ncbi:MAG TPA: chloride channel protein [Acidimicrobiales bacterium]|nr:chloride channel protein [Acidimicrobiales bacterium]
MTDPHHTAAEDRPSPASPSSSVSDALRHLVRFDLREHGRLLAFLGRWVVLGSAVGVLAGVSSAAFLTFLARATDARADRPWLLYLLPVAGLVVGLVYRYVGGRSPQGNNLILEEVHGVEPEGPVPEGTQRWVPRRMAPLVLFGTLATHLFGGSAGREGTAIQMAGSLTDAFARLFGLRGESRRLLLIAAIAGGFGAVFGVPLAGAVFALEVQTVGRLRHDALVPALTASIVGSYVVHLLDWHHDVTPGIALVHLEITPLLLIKVAAAGLAFGAASAVFSELVFGLKRLFGTIAWSPMRPAVGGVVVIGLTLLVGTNDYLGLSLPLIGHAYTGDVLLGAFALKLLFTAVTLGSGFQGGEVTPLFVIGATLGATVAHLLHAPPALLAAVGFVAVFAGATNTPLACTVMGMELFGTGAVPYFAVGCAVSYVFSAHRGIYEAQRVDGSDPDLRLGALTERRPGWIPRRRPSDTSMPPP